MKKETQIWYIVYNTSNKRFLYYEDDGTIGWTNSAFGAHKESTNIRLRHAALIQRSLTNSHTVVLRIKETIEIYE